MAKKRKALEAYVHEQFHFQDNTEYIIFLVWALFVSAFFVTFTK